MKHIHRFSALSLLLAAAAMPAGAQVQQGEKPTEQQIAAGEAPAVPIFEGETAYRGLGGTMVARPWNRAAAEQLLTYIERVDEEGLDPADYAPDRLRAALQGRDPAALNHAATDSFLKLSAALALGTVPIDARDDWHMKDPDLDGADQFGLIERVLRGGESVATVMESLLPTHLQYAELKGVLANADDQETIDKVRTNLERWRWLEPTLGERYVLVNIAGFEAGLYDDDRLTLGMRAIVGTRYRRTPIFSDEIRYIVFSPYWNIPASIARNEIRPKGRDYMRRNNIEELASGRLRQRPGPDNSLGRVKFMFPNDFDIYLHHTPSEELFAQAGTIASEDCAPLPDGRGPSASARGCAASWGRCGE